MTSRLIISGTREELSAEDRAMVAGIVEPYLDRAGEVGVGDCRTGIDALALDIAPHALVFVADWQAFGKRAGPYRNGQMVEWAGEVGTLLAFPGPSSRGTWDCVRQARAAGLSVLIKRVGGAR